MIVKVIMDTVDSGEISMLFGNSYKCWEMQLSEYIQRHKNKIVSINQVYDSTAKWKAWAGLKWCPEDTFQMELNREGCQQNEPDNPKPRQYGNMIFRLAPKKKEICIRRLKA